MDQLDQPDHLCNLCGHSCYLLEDADSTGFTIFRKSDRGGVDISVSGGYYSTPGVCSGALDDMVSYQFSLCEFCLDWMFSQFKIPVKVDYEQTSYAPKEEEFKPAPQRVFEDNWRTLKEKFFKEATLRAESKGRDYKDLERYKKLLPFK